MQSALTPIDEARKEQALLVLRPMAAGLDALGVAVCAFDEADGALLWNRSFLRFFPEHAAHIHAGEPYADNLRRFYLERLGPEELPLLEQYVREGIARHRTQQQPFSFEHRGARLQVNAIQVPGAGRVRIWRSDEHAAVAGDEPAEAAATRQSSMPAIVESTLLDHVADGVMVTDAAGRILWVNEPFVTMLGLCGRASAIGMGFIETYRLAWHDHAPGEHALFEHGLLNLAENMRFAGAPFELPLPGDCWSRVVAQRSPDDRRFYVLADITLLKRQQHQLQAAEARARESEALLKSKSMLLEATLDRMEQGIMMVNSDRVVEVCNRRARELLELPDELMARRPGFGEILAYQWATDEFRHTSQDVLQFIRAGGILDRPHSYIRKRPDGRVIEIQSVPIEGGGVVRTYADITERKRNEERIEYLAHHDGLTSLSNRDVFLEALQRATSESRDTGEVFAVYFIDLDKFKQINDRFGHAVGDLVLVEAADRLRLLAAEFEVAARLGGDEFAILKRRVDGAAEAMVFAERLLDSFRPPIAIENHTLRLGASIGVALYPSSGDDADLLLRTADSAMYQAKASGAGHARLLNRGVEPVGETSPG